MSAPAPRERPDPRIGIGLAVAAAALVVLIAATVVLRTPGAAPALLTVSVTSSDGNWTLRVVGSDASLSTDSVYFLTRRPSGEAFSPLTALANLSGFFVDQTPEGLVSPGDALVLPQSVFPAGIEYWFLESDRLLAVGTFA